MSVIRVVHRTTFSYDQPVLASYNEARMRPAATAGQRVLDTELHVPTATHLSAYTDYFGTTVDVVEVLAPHETLTVRAECLVERDPAQRFEGASWEDVRRPEAVDALGEWLQPDPVTDPPEELARFAADAAARLDPQDAAIEICEHIGDRVEYRSGVTSVHGLAADAWRAGKGVCQDITHLALGALRSVGIPARYVSGYIHPESAQVGEPVLGESHAWVEFSAGRWTQHDPTNRTDVGELHVRVAHGRSYADVSPLRGVYSGGGTSRQTVEVRTTRES
ncbi:transglutaminase family protein [Georgenia sp. Z1491]|uniref:transglutaminase family protein n=1 Tax=Georgenia sp. Z1491 TaxID=3416707 RepID=UPI003CE93AD7